MRYYVRHPPTASFELIDGDAGGRPQVTPGHRRQPAVGTGLRIPPVYRWYTAGTFDSRVLLAPQGILDNELR